MANILLLEPAYKNKYPPLGLMKIAYYHKEHRGDIVRFAKGKLHPEENAITHWDRIYVSTLFTFEWEETEKTIDYAISLIDDKKKIFVGGIAATLLADHIRELKPQINVVEGLLNVKGKLGYSNDDIIDNLPPDYSILEQIQYKYPSANSFFAYTTRGCGMNCSFCAVKTLEPKYIPRVSIKYQISEVSKKYGEKKDLLLMDNNVLKSRYLKEIVEEIKTLGFSKGSKFYNPKTGKKIKRCVDFNQGLDAKLLNEEKAQLLSELELRPVRIAFDHINDKEVYIDAITRCVNAGLREFSNYILYNTDESQGKGNTYPPDTPSELYERLKISMNLQEELNEGRIQDDKVSIYSFPMRYIPLNALKRGYVGQGWNAKYLRAVQVMLAPTQGKGVGTRGFFEADFGSTLEEFKKTLVMPEQLIASRGHFVDNKKDETSQEKEIRKQKWTRKRKLINEWERLFNQMDSSSELNEFINILGDNKIEPAKYFEFSTECQKKAYIFYLSPFKFFTLLGEVENNPKECKLIFDYCVNEFPCLLHELSEYINENKPPFKKVRGYLNVFRERYIEPYLKKISVPNLNNSICSKDKLLGWEKAFQKIRDKAAFVTCIKTTTISSKIFKQFTNNDAKKTYIYYFSIFKLLNLLEEIDSENDIELLHDFFIKENPKLIETLAQYIIKKSEQKLPVNISGYLHVFGESGVKYLLKLWLETDKNINLLAVLEKGFNSIQHHYTDIIVWGLFIKYLKLDVFSIDECNYISNLLFKGEYDNVYKTLEQRFPRYKDKYLSMAPNDFTAECWKKASLSKLEKFYNENFQKLY